MLVVVAFWFDAGVPGNPGDPDEEGVNPGIVSLNSHSSLRVHLHARTSNSKTQPATPGK